MPTSLPQWAPADTTFSSPAWHLEALDVPRVWAATRGAGITVAVLDGGLDAVEGLEAARIERLTPEGKKDTGGDRAQGHGTACASLIASASAGAPGVAPLARIVSINVAGSAGRPLPSKVERALRLATTLADVISCSIVLPTVSPSLAAAVRDAHNAGKVVVGAAGNRADEPNEFPELTLNVLTVAAVSRGRLPLKGARLGKWIDVAAPGEDLLVTTRVGPRVWRGQSSGAAALVAGVCALMLSVAKGAGRLSAAARALPGLVESTALDVPPKGKDVATGRGVIAPTRLLQAVQKLP